LTAHAKALCRSVLVRVFVDNVLLHKWWRCHRISGRSFFVGGRQFHVCARCTGILIGYTLAPLMLLSKHAALYLFPLFLLLMAIDGGTQLFGLRESNNALRLATGLGFGLTLPPFFVLAILAIGGALLNFLC